MSWLEEYALMSTAFQLVIATTINCFPSRVYGEMEFYLSLLKVVTIIVVIILCILIDLGASWQGCVSSPSLPFSAAFSRNM